MSFGGEESDGALSEFQNKFVSQDALDDKRKKRQEEWEKVRKPEDPEEVPEEAYDPRCLYDRLEEQKMKKQEEHDELFALKNQVKGLGEDEVEFLDFVSKRQEDLDKKRQKEDTEVLKEYRSAIAAETLEKADSQKKTSESKSSRLAAQGKKSQQSLLMGAVKRKSTNSDDSKQTDESLEKKQKTSDSAHANPTSSAPKSNGIARIIGILPGLGAYDDSSDEKDSSSDSTSDDAEGLGLMLPKKVIVIQHQ